MRTSVFTNTRNGGTAMMAAVAATRTGANWDASDIGPEIGKDGRRCRPAIQLAPSSTFRPVDRCVVMACCPFCQGLPHTRRQGTHHEFSP